MSRDPHVALSELVELQLGEEALEEYLAEVARSTVVTEVRVKGAPLARSGKPEASLADVCEALRSRQIAGVQLVYSLRESSACEGSFHYCDTLLVAADRGYRLIRRAID